MSRRSLPRRPIVFGALSLAVSQAVFPLSGHAQATQSVPVRAADLTKLTARPAANPAPGKPITLDDYGRFERIGTAALSNDGKWMTWTVTPNDGTGTLYLRQLDGDHAPIAIARGANGAFSESSRYFAY